LTAKQAAQAGLDDVVKQCVALLAKLDARAQKAALKAIRVDLTPSLGTAPVDPDAPAGASTEALEAGHEVQS
jgi:hypothetical protein